MPKKPFYSDAADVPGTKRVDTAPVPSPRYGSLTPSIVPKKPARTGALVQPKKFKESGHPRAHRVGRR